MKRHALFVGVNNYMDKDIRNLRYSIPDAAVLADRFKGFGYKTVFSLIRQAPNSGRLY